MQIIHVQRISLIVIQIRFMSKSMKKHTCVKSRHLWLSNQKLGSINSRVQHMIPSISAQRRIVNANRYLFYVFRRLKRQSKFKYIYMCVWSCTTQSGSLHPNTWVAKIKDTRGIHRDTHMSDLFMWSYRSESEKKKLIRIKKWCVHLHHKCLCECNTGWEGDDECTSNNGT